MTSYAGHAAQLTRRQGNSIIELSSSVFDGTLSHPYRQKQVGILNLQKLKVLTETVVTSLAARR